MTPSDPIEDSQLSDMSYPVEIDLVEYYFGIWRWGWFGTMTAGGLYAFFFLPFGVPLCGALGCIVFSIPLYATIATFTWGFFLTAYGRMWVALLAGLVGIFLGYSAAHGATPLPSVGLYATSIALCVSGALVGSRYFMRRNRPTVNKTRPERQFSLRQLFLRTAVLSFLIYFWSYLLRLIIPR